MKYQYDIAIIGAGSGGLVVASAGASMGAKVLLVEGKKLGGDCLNYGCVPSKTFLKSAHLAQKIRKANNYGLNSASFETSMKDVMGRVSDVIAEIAPHDSKERFEGLGVDVKLGKGKLIDHHTIEVNGERFSAKSIVISTGSRAFVPELKGLENVKYYTNENIFSLDFTPKRLIVLGAGPIGLELGQGFAHLGSEVHIVNRSAGLFTKDDPEVSDIMKNALIKDGINLHLSTTLNEVSEVDGEIVLNVTQNGEKIDIKGDLLLVSVGRVPNTEGLGLENIGVITNKRGFIEVDDYLRTNIKNIFACGDVRGKYLFTHAAGYEASVVVKNALITPFFKANYYNMSWTTYTVPEVAHVGLTLKDADEAGKLAFQYKLPISQNDRAKAEDDREGFVKVLLDNKKRVIGATIVGEHAGEMLPVFSLMLTKKMKLSSLMSVIYQYPVQGEILKSLALDDFKSSAKDWQRNLLKKIVTR